jgi:hypothetical protein
MNEYISKPDFKDDFNYPSLNRKDLMNLDTIKEKDFKKKGINRLISNRNWSMGLYNLDIDKSSPKKRDLYLNKIDFINKIDDIEKARPNKEKIYNKPNFSLYVRDIEKAYPKKERQFHKNIFNENNLKENLENNRYIKNYNYNNNNEIKKNNDIYNSMKKYNSIFEKNINNNNINSYQRNNLSSISLPKPKIIPKKLDTLGVLQSQKEYKDTIHDIFNHYLKYSNYNLNKDFYYLNHNHDLFLGIPNKDNRLDILMDKSNKYLSYDFSEKLNFLENNKKYNNDIMIKPNSVKINKKIPLEFKNQGLEKLYKELDNYKPRTYEQNMDLFTQKY